MLIILQRRHAIDINIGALIGDAGRTSLLAAAQCCNSQETRKRAHTHACPHACFHATRVVPATRITIHAMIAVSTIRMVAIRSGMVAISSSVGMVARRRHVSIVIEIVNVGIAEIVLVTNRTFVSHPRSRILIRFSGPCFQNLHLQQFAMDCGR